LIEPQGDHVEIGLGVAREIGSFREVLSQQALVPRQGASQILGQFADVLGERGHHRCRVLPWKLDEHRKAAVALDECCDVCILRSVKKVSFPMARHGAILDLRGTLRVSAAAHCALPPRSVEVIAKLCAHNVRVESTFSAKYADVRLGIRSPIGKTG
jgi:hypothetical protein